MSIKLICSDIDGTLLQYGKKELESEIFEQIRELHRRGILFCPASGRQYTSLCKLFAPVADCCVFLCENGGVPEVVIEVDDLSAYNVGYLIYFFWRACACSGYLLSVNPFNQPGVESYKKNMFALLGKPGYENLTAELEAKLK